MQLTSLDPSIRDKRCRLLIRCRGAVIPRYILVLDIVLAITELGGMTIVDNKVLMLNFSDKVYEYSC